MPKQNPEHFKFSPFVSGAFLLDLQLRSMRSSPRSREERNKSMKWCELCNGFFAQPKLSMRRDGIDYGNCSKCGMEHWSWRWRSEEL
jgi:hypothetical protein